MKERYIKTFGNAYEIASPNSHELMRLLSDGCKRDGILLGVENVFSYLHEFPEKNIQPELFG